MEERIEHLKTTNRNQSPITGRQDINTITTINSKIYNTKNINDSSKKKNLNHNTIDSCNSKLFISDIEEKGYQNLATKVRIQNNIIDEYQKWINILLTAINNKKIETVYSDIGTPIQEGLEDIEKIKIKNFEIKTLIIQKKINNENMEKQIEKNKKMQNMLIKEFNEKDNSKGLNLKKEKEQLIFNVQMLANELDDLNENNKQIYDKIQADNKLQKLYDLINLRNKLKEENKLYKKMIVLKNRKNFIDLNGSNAFNNKTIDIEKLRSRKIKKKYNSNNIENLENNLDMENDYGSIGPISGYGEYKLEKEENVNKSFFFCGL